MNSDSGFQPDFPAVGHGILRELRDGHFWFDHRKTCILEVVNACLSNSPGARILEFGCGDGDVLAALAREHRAFGLERRLEDLTWSRGRLSVVAGEGAAPPFSRSFDLVGLFDVVEHVTDDVGLLRIASALGRPGGWLVLTVPSEPSLWTTLDEYAGHKRRYTRRMVEDLCAQASVELVSVTPLFRVLWPLGRLRSALRGHREITNPQEEYRVPFLWNQILAGLLRAERRLFGRSSWGTGTSWIAVARLPT